MMRRVFLVLVGSLLLPTGVRAQSDQATIERALAPMPERARAETTVVRWNADHTYDVLKEGSGPMVCYDRSGEPRRAPFDVQCTSMSNLERVAQNRRFRAMSADRQEEGALVAAAAADGTRVLPEFGSLWVSMRGEDRSSAGIHTTIAMPGATSASTGLPEDRSAGGAYIMAAGSTEAHLMVPGR
jgi:hypothetical protein